MLSLFQIPVNHCLSSNRSYNIKVNKNKSTISINNNKQKRVEKGEKHTTIDFNVTITGWLKMGLMS